MGGFGFSIGRTLNFSLMLMENNTAGPVFRYLLSLANKDIEHFDGRACADVFAEEMDMYYTDFLGKKATKLHDDAWEILQFDQYRFLLQIKHVGRTEPTRYKIIIKIIDPDGAKLERRKVGNDPLPSIILPSLQPKIFKAWKEQKEKNSLFGKKRRWVTRCLERKNQP